jgi:uncharacterized coiled-coil protein SlyX
MTPDPLDAFRHMRQKIYAQQGEIESLHATITALSHVIERQSLDLEAARTRLKELDRHGPHEETQAPEDRPDGGQDRRW